MNKLAWERKAFKDVGRVVTGTTPRTKNDEYYGGDIPFVRPSELNGDHLVTRAKTYLTSSGAERAKVIPENSVMVCCIGSLGKVGMAGRELATNQQINSIVFDENQVFPRFGYYYCRTLQSILEHMAPSTTIAIVNKSRFESIKIPLPPLEEQRRIAAILDKAEELRQKRRRALARLDDLLQSVFLEMFGDPGYNPKGWDISEMTDIAREFQNGIGKNKEFYGKGTKVANIGDLYKWHTFKPEKYSLLQVTEKEIGKFKLSFGDLLFVRSSVKREGVAFCSMYASDETCLFSSFMIRVKIYKSKMLPEFLAFLLRTSSMRKQLVNVANTGTITNISQKGLSSVKFIVPPVKLQKEFLNLITSIEKRKAKMIIQAENLITLFGSLQQKAFRGEL